MPRPQWFVEAARGRHEVVSGILQGAATKRMGACGLARRVADLIAFVSGNKPHTEVFDRVQVTPDPQTAPELWVLGSSFESGLLAAELGMPYSFAHFINAPATEKSLEIYRARFKPSGLLTAPSVNLGVFVICAETREEARVLARSRDLWRVRFEAGEFKPMPSIEEAAAYEFSEAELASIDRTSAHRVQGTPNEVYDQLMSLAKRFAVEEIVVLSVTPTYLQRMRCYELLADAFDLTSLGEASDEAPREEVTL